MSEAVDTPTEHYEVLDSTSAEARRRFESGVDGPLWIRADVQTAGYGRRGRRWQSAKGNLAATLLVPAPTPLPPEGPAAFSFAAAEAVRNSLQLASRSAGRLPVHPTFKWPNDVLLDGGKIAGILIEYLTEGSRACMAIGIGVNLTSAPADVPYPTVCLFDDPVDAMPPEHVLEWIDGGLQSCLNDWHRFGFESLRASVQRGMTGLGERADVQLPSGTVSGVVEGLSDLGGLLLRTSEGLREVTAGDVFFPGGTV